jgi:iron-sulfur cluster assembly accessory protein
MVRFGGGDTHGFRLVVTPGGCSGLNSEFSVEAVPQAGDVIFEQAGLRLFLPAESAEMLDGATMDFADTATTTGLTFQTRGKGACACSSASAPPPGMGTVPVSTIERRAAPTAES